MDDQTLKHSKQAKSKGKDHCFWSLNKIWTLPIGTFDVIKNVIELKKLWPPKVEGVKNSKITNHHRML